MPYTKVKHLCQLCGGSQDVKHLFLMDIVNVSLCRNCRIHFCISEEEARKGRVDSISKRDGWKEGLRCQEADKRSS